MTISFVACAKRKANKKCIAEKMYISTLYTYSLQYAKEHSDIVYILSAKHGLLALDKIIDPYNETLNDKSDKEIKEWSKKVFNNLIQLNLENNNFLYLCGNNYKKYLMQWLPGEDPLQGLGLGKRLQWLKNHIKKSYNIFD
jgi:hypothetical protein